MSLPNLNRWLHHQPFALRACWIGARLLLLLVGVQSGFAETTPSSSAIAIDCEAIIRDGVFDEHRVRPVEARIDQAKAAFCGFTRSSQSFAVEVDGGLTTTEREALCAGDPHRLAQDILDRAGSLIVSAFNECAYRNRGEVTHGIFTTDDPAVFTYHVQYTPDPAADDDGSIAVDSLEAHNATCRPPLDLEREISPGRRTLICTRKPDDPVIIALNTKGNVGTRYLEPLRLGAYAGDGAVSAAPSEPPVSPPAAAAGPVVMHHYSRFQARRRIVESSCDGPSTELQFDVPTQVKLVGKAAAQGGASRYPLWVQLKAGDEVSCEEQAWIVGRG
ncbi:MAG: hypothetical protein P8Y69_13600, partial [Gammaproteobacteria bacterium]